MRLFLCSTLIAYLITPHCSGQPLPADTTRYVRLIFIADCFSAAENSSFSYAAANLAADYERDPLIRVTVKRIYFHSGKQVVDSINHQKLVIKSVDFLSHAQNDRIGAQIMRHRVNYRSSLFESKKSLQLATTKGGPMPNSNEMASIEQIDFTRFSYDAVVEVHGCHGGSETDSIPVSFCRRLSAALYMSGKQLAVAIGHGTRANPNYTPATISLSPARPASFRDSVISQDYRHGLRILYFNGHKIRSTKLAGQIPPQLIVSSIVEWNNASAGRLNL